MKLLDALNSRNSGVPPIWLMRQAGRYLPQYRALKQGRQLYDLFHDSEMIVKVTKLPIDLLDFDAAIVFSDILTVLEGLNLRYSFQEGPVIFDLPEKAEVIDPPYTFLTDAMRQLKRDLKVPLLGFCGAPFTIAGYIIEGKSSHDLKKTKQWIFSEPKSFKAFLDKITDATILYLKKQIAAGVDAIQIFDSSAYVLGISEFRTYSIESMKRICTAITEVPIILFAKGSSFFAPELAKLSPAALSLDWSCDLGEIRPQIPQKIALQGNLDPMILYGTRDTIRAAVDRIWTSMRTQPGYIFNLGHGILPDTPVDNVQFLIDYVRSRFASQTA